MSVLRECVCACVRMNEIHKDVNRWDLEGGSGRLLFSFSSFPNFKMLL